jgi:hypothetical protein
VPLDDSLLVGVEPTEKIQANGHPDVSIVIVGNAH